MKRALLLVPFIVFACSDKTQQGRQIEEDFALQRRYERGPLELTLRVTRTEITIAEKLALILEANVDAEYELQFPSFGEQLSQFAIVDYTSPAARLLADERLLYQRRFVLEPFLSGEYTIPSMVVYFGKQGEEKHQITTEEITITVTSLLPEDKQELSIEDIVGLVALPRTRLVWPWVTAVAVVAGMGAYLLLRRKQKRVSEIVTPPHEIAFKEFAELLAEKLLDKRQVKQFYRRMSEILRHYIENRFGLRAPEQTTEEFLIDLQRSTVLTDEHKRLLATFLRHCDVVKFAEYSPATEEIERSFGYAKELVLATQGAMAEGSDAGAEVTVASGVRKPPSREG